MPMFLGQLAVARSILGEPERGLALLDEAIGLAEETKEMRSVAELFRDRGGILATIGKCDLAEKSFITALDFGRRQDARMWELRAATSLARFWRDIGRRVEAHNLLASVYGWFTEGFDTPDLKDARSLLAELA